MNELIEEYSTLCSLDTESTAIVLNESLTVRHVKKIEEIEN